MGGGAGGGCEECVGGGATRGVEGGGGPCAQLSRVCVHLSRDDSRN